MSTATKVKVRAYELSGDFSIEALKVAERSLPELKPNEVRVQIKAVSLNYRDLLVIKGLYSRNLKLPLVPTSDGAGEVVEIGELVSRVKVGDRVAGIFMQRWIAGSCNAAASQSSLGGAVDGMLADQVILNEEGLVHIPSHLSFEEASTLPCAAVTAWNALNASGQIKSGETVLTMGTGGVSLFALQFAKIAGARVIITSSSDDKLKRVKEMGVSDVINYKKTPDWEKAALELTNGGGVDHLVELGGAGTLSRSFKACKIGGTISLIGVLSGGDGVNPMPILMKHLRLQGIYVGSRQMFEDMNRAIELHKLKPVIDKVFEFDQAKEALKHMESGAHFGKIVIKI
jgi:NADPH:quinone reductase-like Zn-dependent oxidoreductase